MVKVGAYYAAARAFQIISPQNRPAWLPSPTRMSAPRLCAIVLALLATQPPATAQTNVPSEPESVFLAPPESTNASSLKESAGKFYQAREYDLAFKAYRQVLMQQPYNDVALWNIAYCCFALSNYSEAILYYNQYIRLSPGVGLAHFWLGYSLVALGQTRSAGREYRKCIDLDPSYGPAYDQLVPILIQAGRGKAAVPFAQKAIELQGRSESRDLWLASALIAARDFSQATNIIQNYISLYPDNARGYNWMGAALMGLHQNALADSYFTKTLKLTPNNFNSQFKLGRSLYEQRSYAIAAQAYLKASRLEPKDAEAHFWRGRSLYRAGQFDEAVAELTTAHELKPYKFEYRTSFWAMCLRTGRFAQAFTADPVGWTSMVGAFMTLSVGGFIMAAFWSLRARVNGPGILVSFLWVIVFFTSRDASTFLLGLITPLHPPDLEAIGILLSPVPLLLMGLIIFPAFSWGGPYTARLNLPLRIWWRFLAAWIVIYIAISIYDAFTEPSISRSGAYIASTILINPISNFFRSVLIDPMAEEIMLRGLLFAALRSRVGLWAIPLTSVIFAGYHFDPPHFVPLFLMGLMLAWAREISGTIWTPFVLHALNNGLYFFLMLAAMAKAQ